MGGLPHHLRYTNTQMTVETWAQTPEPGTMKEGQKEQITRCAPIDYSYARLGAPETGEWPKGGREAPATSPLRMQASHSMARLNYWQNHIANTKLYLVVVSLKIA